MTDEYAFKIVKSHLLSQQEKSTVDVDDISFFEHFKTESCAYRGKNGLKCAIGVLIPDNQYTKGLEGKLVAEILARNLVPALKGISPQLLMELQTTHDMYPVTWWEKRLNDIAIKFGFV